MPSAFSANVSPSSGGSATSRPSTSRATASPRARAGEQPLELAPLVLVVGRQQQPQLKAQQPMSNTDSNTNSNGTPIDGAVALVTGGNRGFGRAMVHELLDRGAAKIYATSRSPQPQTDSRIVALVLDVTDDDSVAAAARAAADVSIVVNNAGLSLRTPVLEAPLDEIRAELETNLFGTIRVARAFAPILARNPSSSLVNVLSVLSWLAFGRGYEVSKAAAWSATNSMRIQLRDQGTTVTALHVGTWTPT